MNFNKLINENLRLIDLSLSNLRYLLIKERKEKTSLNVALDYFY